MDSEFPRDRSCEPQLKPELLPLDRIILFSEENGAEAFLEYVFPFFANCIVASADGVYPRDPDLNAAVFGALREKEKIRVAVFQLEALKSLPLKTDRILVMDDLLMQDFKRHPADRALSFSFTPERIAFLLDAFFCQWDKMERLGNTAFPYANFKEYKQEKFDWRSALLGLQIR